MHPQYHSLLAEDPSRCAGTARCLPRPSLRTFVAGYAAFRADVEGHASRRLLPLNLTTMIIDIDGLAGLVTGPRSTPAVCDHLDWRHGVAIGLTPAGVAALFGMPASELVGLSLPLAALGVRTGALASRLRQLSGWPDRFAALEDQLMTWLRPEKAPAARLMHAWRRLQQPAAGASIEALASELGITRRGLELGFQRHIGLPPKTVARIARFQHAMHALSQPGTRLATASEHGYADQPHLSREVRAMSGLTPTELFAIVQDSRATLD